MRIFNRPEILVLAVFLALLGLAGTAAAYYSDQDTKVNKITVGVNDTSITEKFPEPPDIPPGGGEYKKEVQIVNHTSVPCYIRAAVEFGNRDIGQVVALKELDTANWIYVDEKDDWKLGGYYYYKEPVLPGEKTTSLFSGVSFSDGMDLSTVEDNDTFEVIIYEESVQQGDCTTYQEAWNSFIRE